MGRDARWAVVDPAWAGREAALAKRLVEANARRRSVDGGSGHRPTAGYDSLRAGV